MARQTFGDFLYVLMKSLVFIIPPLIPISLTIALLGLGVTRGVGFFRQAAITLKNKSMRRLLIVLANETAIDIASFPDKLLLLLNNPGRGNSLGSIMNL
jgi:hypothetical protein